MSKKKPTGPGQSPQSQSQMLGQREAAAEEAGWGKQVSQGKATPDA